jgi:hypothetical protein
MVPPRLAHLPADRLVPPPDVFLHPSRLHGQRHVARVMVHAFRLAYATGADDDVIRLWAAVYLHDLARTHDGVCHRHGADAWRRLPAMPDVLDLFHQAGVTEADLPAIRTAVTYHCLRAELRRDHRHWPLTALLKDADGLDRVRIGDLDPGYLRLPASAGMIDFARRLFTLTNDVVDEGPGYFPRLAPHVQAILSV